MRDRTTLTPSLPPPLFEQAQHVCTVHIITSQENMYFPDRALSTFRLYFDYCLQLLSLLILSHNSPPCSRKNKGRRPLMFTGCVMTEVGPLCLQSPVTTFISRFSDFLAWFLMMIFLLLGLTLLLPYLLTRRKRWARCKVRVFVGGEADKKDEQKEE